MQLLSGGFLSATSLFLAVTFTLFSLLPCALLSKPPSVFLSLLACLLFFNATAIFRFYALALTALRLDALILPLNRFLGLATLQVDLVLMLAGLLFEHIPFDVSCLAANLDVDHASATLRAGHLQIALRLTLERDLARSSVAIRLAAAVAATQMREQFELRVVADSIVRAGDLDAGLIELHEQPIDGHLQDFRKLCNCDFCHWHSSLSGPLRTSARVPS
jgi:hypothetical protein